MKPNDPDNWEPTSDHMKCSSCMRPVPKVDVVLGRCQRREPTLGGCPAGLDRHWRSGLAIDENRIAKRDEKP